jgi:hypothetical protein
MEQNFGKLWDRKLFHGTNFNFDVGQLIVPSVKSGIESNYDPRFLEGLQQHAFATSDVNEAVGASNVAVNKKGFGQSSIYSVSPILNSENDLDYDPNSSRGIRSRTGFKVEGRLTAEALEDEKALDAARGLVTNSLEDLRINQSGKAYFLHSSIAEIPVGNVINASSADNLGRGMAMDALPGKSYAWDALNEGSIYDAYDVHKGGYIYLTNADASLVGPDLNVRSLSTMMFKGSNARAIRRRANYFR